MHLFLSSMEQLSQDTCAAHLLQSIVEKWILVLPIESSSSILHVGACGYVYCLVLKDMKSCLAWYKNLNVDFLAVDALCISALHMFICTDLKLWKAYDILMQ